MRGLGLGLGAGRLGAGWELGTEHWGGGWGGGPHFAMWFLVGATSCHVVFSGGHILPCGF